MTELNQLFCPALILIFLVPAVLVLCACAMAGRAADNADEAWRNIHEEKQG